MNEVRLFMKGLLPTAMQLAATVVCTHHAKLIAVPYPFSTVRMQKCGTLQYSSHISSGPSTSCAKISLVPLGRVGDRHDSSPSIPPALAASSYTLFLRW